MKNFLHLIICGVLFLSVMEQSMAQQILSAEPEMPATFERTPEAASTAGGEISYWFNYGEDIYLIAQDQGGDVSYFRSFLFPDSTVTVEFSDGFGPPWKHSMGQVFDPVAPLFSVYSPLVNQFDYYMIDSIGFFYRYFRFQDSAPDTLIVQVYEDDNITFVADPGWTSGASYASVDYDYMARIGDNADYTYTYLLTNDDTISTTQGFIGFPVNVFVSAGKKIAATITYLPGNPYNVGDTLDVYVVPAPVNKRNAFVTYEYRDNDFNLEPGYYNNQLVATTEIRYNTSTNGWNGSYIPGTAWNGGFYHLDMEFHINNTSSVTENSIRNFNLFPNPADESITLSFSSTENSVAEISVLDIAGREVYALDNVNIVAENNRIQLQTESLTPGVYFCRIAGSDFSENIRFIKK